MPKPFWRLKTTNKIFPNSKMYIFSYINISKNLNALICLFNVAMFLASQKKKNTLHILKSMVLLETDSILEPNEKTSHLIHFKWNYKSF